MRRLLVFVSVVVAVDTLFFTAMTPLLPQFADKYDLSKAGAGVFISTYAAGALIGAIPAGLATTRLGPKRTVLAGLVLMTAASLGFALAGNVWALGASRLFQGIGSSFSWAGGLAWVIAAAPRERRGALLAFSGPRAHLAAPSAGQVAWPPIWFSASRARPFAA